MNPVKAICAALLVVLSATTAFSADDKEAKRFISSFGRDFLVDVHLVAEVEVEKVWKAGMGVAVARMRLKTNLFDELSPPERKKVPVLVLCNKGEFVKGTHLLLFLARFRGGDRCLCRHRLSMMDKYYDDKLRLIREYITVERIRDLGERCEAFKALLLKNVSDSSPWIRWNSLHELDDLVKKGKAAFNGEDVRVIDEAVEGVISEAFRKSLQRIRETIADRIEKEKDQ